MSAAASVADSLRHVIALKDAQLAVEAGRILALGSPSLPVSASPSHSGSWASDLFTTVLGSVLAAAVAICLMYLTRNRERADQRLQVAQVVGAELLTFQARILGACIQLAGRCERLDFDLLTRLQSAVPDGVLTDDLNRTASTIAHLKSLPDPQTAWNSPKPPGAERTSLAMKRYSLPYLDSGSARIDLLQHDTRVILLQVRTALDLFNQHVDDASRYHWMTFDELAAENHQAVQANLDKTYLRLLEAALKIADVAASALSSSDFARVRPSKAEVENERQDLASPDVVATGTNHEALERRKARAEAARALLRPANLVRSALSGLEAKVGNRSVFELVGPDALRKDLDVLGAALSDLTAAGTQLLALRDDELEASIKAAATSAEQQGADITKLGFHYYRENARPDRPWDSTLARGFERPALSIRTHSLPAWDAIVGRLTAHASG